MADSEFRPGQRWVSNTESELGLGLVESNELRRVTLSFPVIGESRTYARDNAPLTRVVFGPGDEIKDRHGVQLTITERAEKNGCYIYLGVDQDGQDSAVHEIDLDSSIQFSKPQDRLFAGQIDSNRSFELRIDTLEHRHAHQTSPAYGLLGPRVQLLPHQLYIADQASRQPAPRLLLADEVGLGKTIEAGLIVHRQLVNQQAQRVLVLVPESLLHQWLVEMLRRFNLSFSLLDQSRCTELVEEGHGNPFLSAQLVLSPVELLGADPIHRQQALEAGFDLLVVDEAHRLSLEPAKGDGGSAGDSLYRAVQTLAANTPGVLLLTATPEQFGEAGHWARLHLLDPHRYPDLCSYHAEHEGYQAVNELIAALLEHDPEQPLPDELQTRVNALLDDGTDPPPTTAIDAEHAPGKDDRQRQQLIDRLLDRHGTGRALFRNTRDAVQGFPERRLQAHPLPASGRASSHERPPSDASNDDPLMEHLLCAELQIGERWLSIDPRVEWLSNWLADSGVEKALVICKRAETARALEEHLRTRQGVRSALFNEQMSLIARDRAAAYFAEPEDGAQVLVCSEIGSEGRNFQFAHNVVLFDLPFDPDLLEQRIGRLDRIGQRETVLVHVPYEADSAQSILLRFYHEGLNAFERTCAAGPLVFKETRSELLGLLCDGAEPGALDPFLERCRRLTDDSMALLRRGRDRLLELNSCREPQATRLVHSVAEAERRIELVDFMERMFDCLGVNQQSQGYSVVLQPGEHMLCSGLPGLAGEAVSATYSRDQALSREDMLFLSWEHPMVTGAMDVIQSGGIGNTALCTLKDSGLAAGTLLVETIFTAHCPAARALQVHRFLPQACTRIVLDANGVDRSATLTRAQMPALVQNVPQKTAREVVKRARKAITILVERARAKAEQQQSAVIEAALANATAWYDEEQSRARALRDADPAQIQAHLQTLAEDRARLNTVLGQTQLRLDAIRVALAV
ncbi:MAG: RNA polymerase-associated protein RapA [Gammaproteobacteria bacterium]|nr:RNA polymerase-associated protein RapA [Gammaproteobacteria bacterium]